MAPRTSAVLREFRALTRLAAPIAAAQAGQVTMGLVDVWLVGRLGARPLGAIGLANSLFFFTAIIGMGVVMGLDPLIAQAVGAGEAHRARRLLWQGAWLALLASGVLSAVLVGGPAALRAAQLNPATAALTTTCLWLRLVSMPGLLLFQVARSSLQARGVTRPMVVSVVACNVFNLVADLLFVFGGAHLPAWTGPLHHMPAMGAPGAALSTTLGTFLQLAIVGAAVVAAERGQSMDGLWRPAARELRRILRVGLPVGLQMGAEVGVFSLATVLAARFGDASVAAHNLALTLASFSFAIAIGVSNAASVRVGWAIGQRDVRAVRRAGAVALATGEVVMAVSAGVLLAAPHWLPALYPGSTDHGVVAVAVPLLAVAAVFQLSDGLQGVCAGVLRGAGDTVFPFVANLVGHYGIGLPVAVWLGFGLHRGVTGLWWGLCCGLTAVALALVARFAWIARRPIAPLDAGAADGDLRAA